MTTGLSGNCWKCGQSLESSDYARTESCRGCDGDTRVCRNCRLYDPDCNNRCREERADRIVDKERSNFCEFFSPGRPEPVGGPAAPPSETKAKGAFESLFKKKK